MMQGILFHTLRGTKGWSWMSPHRSFDIAKITEVYVRPRLFCLLDLDKPYRLSMEYFEPETESGIAPGFSSNGKMTFSFYEKTVLKHEVTARYKTREDAVQDMNEILQKQYQLVELASKLRTGLILRSSLINNSSNK